MLLTLILLLCFIPANECDFEHRKVLIKRQRDVRQQYEMLNEIGRYMREIFLNQKRHQPVGNGNRKVVRESVLTPSSSSFGGPYCAPYRPFRWFVDKKWFTIKPNFSVGMFIITNFSGREWMQVWTHGVPGFLSPWLSFRGSEVQKIRIARPSDPELIDLF